MRGWIIRPTILTFFTLCVINAYTEFAEDKLEDNRHRNCTLQPHLPCTILYDRTCGTPDYNNGDLPSRPSDVVVDIAYEGNEGNDTRLLLSWKLPKDRYNAVKGFEIRIVGLDQTNPTNHCIVFNLSQAVWTRQDQDEIIYKFNYLHLYKGKYSISVTSLPQAGSSQRQTTYLYVPRNNTDNICRPGKWKTHTAVSPMPWQGKIMVLFGLAPHAYHFKHYHVILKQHKTNKKIEELDVQRPGRYATIITEPSEQLLRVEVQAFDPSEKTGPGCLCKDKIDAFECGDSIYCDETKSPAFRFQDTTRTTMLPINASSTTAWPTTSDTTSFPSSYTTRSTILPTNAHNTTDPTTSHTIPPHSESTSVTGISIITTQGGAADVRPGLAIGLSICTALVNNWSTVGILR